MIAVPFVLFFDWGGVCGGPDADINLAVSIFPTQMFIATVLLSAVATAQCKPDLLIDDFAKVDVHAYEGADRNFNLVGGDYGAVGITATYEPENKRVKLVSNAADNFWFSKFDLQACYNLNGYTAITFDFEAPVGTDASFTLTQKSPDCKERLVDSQYVGLGVPMDGTKKSITLPLSGFSKNLNGTDFDMVHLKDWTLVGLKPIGTTAYFSNFVLKGNCNVPSSTTGASPTNGGSSNPISGAEHVVASAALGAWAFIAALF